MVKASLLTNTREKSWHLGIQMNTRKNPWETKQSDKREQEEMNSQRPKVKNAIEIVIYSVKPCRLV